MKYGGEDLDWPGEGGGVVELGRETEDPPVT